MIKVVFPSRRLCHRKLCERDFVENKMFSIVIYITENAQKIWKAFRTLLRRSF